MNTKSNLVHIVECECTTGVYKINVVNFFSLFNLRTNRIKFTFALSRPGFILTNSCFTS